MKVLIACDKFKGSLSAAKVAAAVRAGLPENWQGVECPIADGGEGFAEAMTKATRGEWVEVETVDALGRKCLAGYGLAMVDGKRTVFLEMAAASGLWRIAAEERNPWVSSTHGTGLLLRHAAEVSRAERIFVGLGGSATHDGGMGFAAALGVRFLNEAGEEVAAGPAGLAELAKIDESRRIALPEIVAACDVDHPLCGPLGAAAVFGPQKGVAPGEVEAFDASMRRLAGVADACQVSEMPGAGAAGGLGFGLVRFAGARLRAGFEIIAEALDLEGRIAAADLVITGEGSLDAQTLGGKGPAGIAAMANAAGVPVIAVAGRSEKPAEALFDAVWSLESFALPLEESIARAGELLTRKVREEAAKLSSSSP